MALEDERHGLEQSVAWAEVSNKAQEETRGWIPENILDHLKDVGFIQEHEGTTEGITERKDYRLGK